MIEYRNTVFPVESNSTDTKNQLQLNWKDWLFHLTILILILIASIVTFLLLTNSNDIDYSYKIEFTILHIGIGLFVVIKVLGDLQGVYLFFGFFRNPFYPTNCLNSSTEEKQAFSLNQNKLFFKIIKYIRIILIRIGKLAFYLKENLIC